MKSNEQLLEEIYSHFPETEDKDEAMSFLIVDSIETGINYWNTKWPVTEDTSKECYSERIWEDVKNGKSLTFGDEDNHGDLNLVGITKALKYLKKHSPELYQEIQEESWDANTCDTFFQIAIFGEVVFG